MRKALTYCDQRLEPCFCQRVFYLLHCVNMANMIRYGGKKMKSNIEVIEHDKRKKTAKWGK